MADLTSFAQTYSNAGAAITTAYLPANNYKSVPSSKFGTRELAFYSVTISGVHTGYTASNSTYVKAIKGIQQVAEVYFVGTPASDAFVVAIATDTDNGQTSANASDESLEVAIERALAVSPGSATVAALAASGASIA
jgi:hypothetical protein